MIYLQTWNANNEVAVDDKEMLNKLFSVIDPPVGETAPAVICVLTQRMHMIDIDVLPWNKAGYSFWKKCGFDESCISMRYVGK